jgi:hypothetical protein
MKIEIDQGLRFRIERAGGAVEELEVDAPRALLGSGAHCEVRLGAHEAAPEHLLVRCTPKGLEAVRREVQAVTLLNGVPFVRGPIADGARFSIGELRVMIERTGSVRARAKAREQRSSRLLVTALSIASVAALVTLLLEPAAGGAIAPPPLTPALWSASDAQDCARAARDEAHELGRMHWRAALMKQERSPYHLEDAMTAVGLFQRAAACFEAAGDQTRRKNADREFERLLLRLEADHHRRRVLLERAIEQRDWRTAAREAGALQKLLGDRHAQYTSWLQSVERLAAAWALPDRG